MACSSLSRAETTISLIQVSMPTGIVFVHVLLSIAEISSDVASPSFLEDGILL